MPSVDKRGEIVCKATLIVVFLVGVALLLGGLWGNRQFEAAGFNQENAFSLVHQLTGETDCLYQKKIAPALKASGADLSAVSEVSRALLVSAWKTEEPLKATLQGLSGDALAERELKLLAMTYAVSGPKIKTAQRKQLAALPQAEQTSLSAFSAPQRMRAFRKIRSSGAGMSAFTLASSQLPTFPAPEP